MKIYTKTGDLGTTALLGGERVSKSLLRIEAYGTVDELNAWMGMLRDQEVNSAWSDGICRIQNDLFVMGAILAVAPGHDKVKIPALEESGIAAMEQQIDAWDEELPPMKYFILPGGHPSISFGHVARTVARRAERYVVRLHDIEPLDPMLIRYLNRLSDYLFVMCRMMAQRLAVQETPWKPN